MSALSIVGLVAFGAFTGCSSDDNSGTPDNDSGVLVTDSGVADSHKDTTGETTGETSSETSTETGDTSDTADSPPVPDRRVNVLFARPDEPSGGLYACLGAFAAGTDPTTATPLQAQGPVGIPNDPKDPTKGFKSGFTYGSVFPLVVNKGDLAGSALDLFDVVGFFLDHDPTTATPPSTCKAEWTTAKADTKRWVKISKGTIKSGDSFLLALVGCNSPAGGSPGECGGATAGDSRDFVATKVDTADPTTFIGTGTTKFGSQFLNATQFSPAATPPTFQDVDVYLQPMNAPASPDAGPDADGGSPTPAGTPIPIAGGPGATAGVKFKDIVSPATGVALAGDPNEAIFLIAPHGTDLSSCTPGGSLCPIIPLPAKPYLDAYKVIGGGFTGNQVIALMGGLGALSTKPPIIAFLPSKF